MRCRDMIKSEKRKEKRLQDVNHSSAQNVDTQETKRARTLTHGAFNAKSNIRKNKNVFKNSRLPLAMLTHDNESRASLFYLRIIHYYILNKRNKIHSSLCFKNQ
jgi:hypothetical protein